MGSNSQPRVSLAPATTSEKRQTLQLVVTCCHSLSSFEMLRDFRVLNHLSSLFSRLPCVDCLQIFSELLPGGPLLMTWAAWNCLKLFCFSSFARDHPMSLIFLPAQGIMNDECGRVGALQIRKRLLQNIRCGKFLIFGALQLPDCQEVMKDYQRGNPNPPGRVPSQA